jgi:hypothetical protein
VSPGGGRKKFDDLLFDGDEMSTKNFLTTFLLLPFFYFFHYLQPVTSPPFLCIFVVLPGGRASHAKQGGRSCPNARFTGGFYTTQNAKKNFRSEGGDRRNAPTKYATVTSE